MLARLAWCRAERRVESVESSRCVAVTGATGFVGSRLCEHLRRTGHRVVALVRNAKASDGGASRPFALGEPVAPDLLRGVDWLIHCAYDFAPRGWDEIERVNVKGSEALFAAADRAEVSSLVFISTVSSFDGCKSSYGRAKRASERQALERGGAVIRPGLVFGPRPGGMLGTLDRLVRALPVVPLIGAEQPLHLGHVEDLSRMLLAAATRGRGGVPRPATAASESARTLRQIVEILAAARGRRVRTFGIPSGPVWLALRGAETLGVPSGLRSDSVTSLMNVDPALDFSMTRELGAAFRDFDASTAIR